MGRFFLLVFLLLVGLGAAWGVCRSMTTVYEARCEVQVSFSRSAEGGFEENLNTRLSTWRSERALDMAVERFRAKHSGDALSDSELRAALEGVEIARVPRARLVSVVARAESGVFAANLANAYAAALVAFTESEAKARADAAVAQIHAQVERQRQVDEKLAKDLLELRTSIASETGSAEQRLLEESLAKASADVMEQEKKVREAEKWASFLQMARKNPNGMGAFPASVPENSEVRRTHKAWSDARTRLANLRTRYTEEHPDIDVAKRLLVASAKQFADVLTGTTKVAESELASCQKQLEALRRTASGLRAELEGRQLRVTEANDKIGRLEQEKKVSGVLYEELKLKENEIRVSAGQDVDRVSVGRKASVPGRPVSPDPVLSYVVGGGGAFLLWLVLGVIWPSPRRH